MEREGNRFVYLDEGKERKKGEVGRQEIDLFT